MGICRGMQMLTTAAGGSLYQDVNAQQGTAHRHQGVSHEIEAAPRLREHIPTTRVNSLHHQAVKTVPYGWETLATAPDGVIESIWRPGWSTSTTRKSTLRPMNTSCWPHWCITRER